AVGPGILDGDWCRQGDGGLACPQAIVGRAKASANSIHLAGDGRGPDGAAPATAHAACGPLRRLVPSSLTRGSGAWRTRPAGVSPSLTTAAWVLRAALASRARLAAAWAAAEDAGAVVPSEPAPASVLLSSLAGGAATGRAMTPACWSATLA